MTGSAWDGEAGPYALDQIAYEKQFGLVQSVEIQPPGQQTWYSAVDTSGANGEITRGNHLFKTWSLIGICLDILKENQMLLSESGQMTDLHFHQYL